jgi:hypothetical protein
MAVRASRRAIAATVTLLVAALVAGSAPAVAQSGGDTTTVTVTVETEDGAPVSGAAVAATWDSGQTSADTAGNGKVFVDVPVGTTVSFDVDHPDYTRNFPFRRTVGENTDSVTVEVTDAVQFTYRVNDQQGDAVEDVRVAVVDGAEREVAAGQTNGDGQFTTEQIEAGSYVVRFTKTGYLTVERTEETGVDVTRRIEAERADAVLAVDVRDPRAGEAVSGATVRVDDKTARTDDSGRATVSVPVNSEARVEVTREGYADATSEASVGESDRTVEVALFRLPSLSLESSNERVVVGESARVTVTDAYDDPAANVTVLVDGEAVATTDGDGEALVPVSETGETEVRARRSRTTSNRVTVEGVSGAGAGTGTTTGTVSTDDGEFPSFGAAPGFGVVAALVALLSLAYLARDSRR